MTAVKAVSHLRDGEASPTTLDDGFNGDILSQATHVGLTNQASLSQAASDGVDAAPELLSHLGLCQPGLATGYDRLHGDG